MCETAGESSSATAQSSRSVRAETILNVLLWFDKVQLPDGVKVLADRVALCECSFTWELETDAVTGI